MFKTILIAAFLAALATISAPALARDEPRIVIGLYDGALDHSSLRVAEPALNYLGLILEPHSTAEALPNLNARGDVRGVLIWLDAGLLGDPAGFTLWLRGVTKAGVPVALMGATPLAEDRFGMFLALGLIYSRDDRPYTYDLRSVEKDTGIVEFERRYDNLFPPADLVRPLDPALSRPLLVLQRRGDVTDRTSPIVVTPKGAYAAPNYAVWWQTPDGAHRWFIDPVQWFRLAFRMGATPAPDVTTLNVRRILAPALLPARGKEDEQAADAAARTASRLFPGIPIALAGPDAWGTMVPRGGSPCANRMRVAFMGFDGALAALDEGEMPRRVARYAPLLSACREEALIADLAVKAVLGHAQALPLIAVPPPQLAAMDAGFASAKLEIIDGKSWRVRDREGVETLRFDETAGMRMDWMRSQGVLGAGRVNGVLYVSLDPAVDTPIVALTDTPWEPPLVPVLVESRWMLSAMERDWSQLTVDVQGFGPGDMVWSVPASSQWDIRLTVDGGAFYRYAATADESGLLAFSLPPLNGKGGTLEMLREDISGPGP